MYVLSLLAQISATGGLSPVLRGEGMDRLQVMDC